jgi:hypothetical protein
MTSFKLLAAATILSALIASSASAQPVIDEPGLFAFYYPNSSLGLGYSRPPADAQARVSRQVMRHPVSMRHTRSAR